MRRLYFLLFLLFLALGIYAQKKEIATARDNLKRNKNIEQAEKSMLSLLKDSANRGNEKIWVTMFDAIVKQYEQGNEKLYLKQKYDTAQFFNLTKRMFSVAETIDSMDVKPDKKGNVSLDYRKRHAEILHRYRPNLYNGGLYFIKKQKFADAYAFFDAYIECGNQPLFSRHQYRESDKKLPDAAYWAVYCGYKMKDPKATLHHTYLALKDTSRYCNMLQYLAETYKLENDTARYVHTLTEGFEKFPLFDFFFPRLVQYHGERGNWEKVLLLAESGVNVNAENTIFRLAKGNALLNLGKYEDCIAICDQLITENDSLSDAYYDAGMAYFQMAVDLDKKIQLNAKQKKKIKDYYQKALPYLICLRALEPKETAKWGMPLYTIYLHLNMGDEFDEIDKVLRRKGK
ncbi:MAG: hypothetical protein J5867_03880 [Prevotella sp.]|nr:hypothetical protein [Prevotella sp.]